MKVTLGVDVACRSAHQASCADERGQMLFVGYRFRTDPDELENLWARLPETDSSEVTVVMEPTRNAWVALAAWFRRHGASVVLVPPEQSADLRAYYNKHTKTDRLDSRVLARLPLLHPEGLNHEHTLGPAGALKRAVKIRSGLVHRRSSSMARLDALLELMGPAWVVALGSDMCGTALRFLARYGAHPAKVRRLGKTRLAEFFRRSSRRAWGQERAGAVMNAVEASLRLWGADGMDFDELAADIAAEARLALAVSDEIHQLDQRIAALYDKVDPDQIVRSAPGVGRVGAPQIAGRLGDVARFANLAAVRSFAGLVPAQDASGNAARAGGPTKAGDACLREAIFLAADHARKVDPTLADRYHRLITEAGKHHNSALCTIAAVLLTRIAACLRNNIGYQIRDTDGTAVTEQQGRAIVDQHYTIPAGIRSARRQLVGRTRQPRRNERAKKGVAERSEAPLVQQPA
ncbi:MAG: IS110 family transposase [Nocardioidaceae bacterium]